MTIYGWFRRHLLGIVEPLREEPPVSAEKAAPLYASATGNMVRDLGGMTPRRLAESRAQGALTGGSTAGLDQLLALDVPVGTVAVKGTTESRKAFIEAVEVESAPGVWIPFWRFRPRAGSAARHMILLEPQGRNSRWNEDSLYQRLAAAGWTVSVPDVRGIGDLRPEFPRQAPGHGRSHQEEEAYAWASMMLGKPLLGQRVTDVLAVRKALGAEARLVASGAMVIPALFAAALDPEIRKVAHTGEVPSYRALVAAEEYREPFANFLFGALSHPDLPRIAAGLPVARIPAIEFDALVSL